MASRPLIDGSSPDEPPVLPGWSPCTPVSNTTFRVAWFRRERDPRHITGLELILPGA